MRSRLVQWAVAAILLVGTAVPLVARPAGSGARLPMGHGTPAPVDIGPTPSDDLLPPRVTVIGPELTLDECLALAYAHHPALQQARESVVQAEANIRVIDGTYLPTVAVQGDKIRGQTPDYDEEIALVLNVQQTIFDSGQRAAQLQSAKANFRASVQNFQTSWINQVQAVRAAYVQALEAEYLQSVAQDSVDRSQLNLEVAQRFYEGGLKSLIDVSTAQVQFSQAQVALAQAKTNVRTARVLLAQTIGIPQNLLDERELVDFLQMPTDLPDRDLALRLIYVQNPSLTSLLSQAKANQETAVANRRSIGPEVTLQAYYGAYGYLHLAVPNWSVEFDLNFPFISPTAYPSADAADAQARQLLAQREADGLKLVQQLDTAIADVEGAKERVERSIEAVREAVLNANLAYKRYQAGLSGSDIQELINARQYLSDSRQDYVQALADMKTAEANFYQAMGVIPRPPGAREDDPLLQVHVDEERARDEAQPGFRPPPPALPPAWSEGTPTPRARPSPRADAGQPEEARGAPGDRSPGVEGPGDSSPGADRPGPGEASATSSSGEPSVPPATPAPMPEAEDGSPRQVSSGGWGPPPVAPAPTRLPPAGTGPAALGPSPGDPR